MLNPYRFTLTMPACVTVDATGFVDPWTSASNSPSTLMVNRSTIAAARMRSAIAEVSDIITELAQFVWQGRAGQAPHAHLGITGHADKR